MYSKSQDHPRATSSCHRLIDVGLWCNIGERLNGDTNRNLESQSAERQGIPIPPVGEKQLMSDEIKHTQEDDAQSDCLAVECHVSLH